MKCYVKSGSTFLTLAQRDTDDYSLVLDSMGGEKSSLTILSEDAPSFLFANWLLINGEVYRIGGASPKNGKTKLTLLPVDTLFDRVLVYSGSSSTVGSFIAGLITSEWINQSDAVYATPYISVTSTDTTPFVAPITEDDGTFNFLDYIREQRQANNVVIHAAYSGNTLALTISKDAPVVHPLVVNDGHTQLISSDFKATALAKITVFYKADAESATVVSDWYLAADGTVSSTVPQDRASGEWGAISISGDEVPADAAAEEFANNETSRKIELYSDVSMAVGDKARIRINGEVVEATVTGIYRKLGEIRTRYKLGDMITTMTEKVDALSSGKTVAVSGGGGEVLPAWLGGSF